MPSPFRTARIPLIAGMGFFMVMVLAEYAAILALNHGFFMYTLDDAYIHLSLAENILHGHYGVNTGEFSAPSSSILWPFLIAPFSSWEIFPLFANGIFAVLTLFVFGKILDRSIRVDGMWGTVVRSVFMIALILATNLIGLVFTGMEHSLQVFVVSAIVYGLIVEAGDNRIEPWLPAAIVIAPLIRYEDISISLAAVLYLLMRRYYKSAVTASLAIVFSVGGFSFFLTRLGLDPVPASIAVKSSVVSTGGSLRSLVDHMNLSMWNPRGMLLCVAFVCLCGFALFARESVKKRQLAALAAMAAAMHLLGGSYGWGNRYEIYIWTCVVLLALYFSGGIISSILSGGNAKRNALKIMLCAGIFVLVLCEPYVRFLFSVPTASNNLYEQVYQMHRFAVDYYRKPVGVNDLGYVSYRNGKYVLDLYGLASREAFESRLSHEGTDAGWMDELARSKQVGLVMVYRSWYPVVPHVWIKTGELHLGKPCRSASDGTVNFYAVDEAAYDEILPELREFAKTLPRGVEFVFADRQRPWVVSRAHL